MIVSFACATLSKLSILPALNSAAWRGLCAFLFLVALNAPQLIGAQGYASLSPDSDPDIGAVIAELLVWIEKNSDYSVFSSNKKSPEVVLHEIDETIQYEGRILTIPENLKGLYDKQADKIILVKPWDVADIDDLSTLLHELVHVVQYKDRLWGCWQRTEWEAYKLQEQWLRERGRDPNFNWIRIYLLSSCAPRDMHP